jgi:hypothetical protein
MIVGDLMVSKVRKGQFAPRLKFVEIKAAGPGEKFPGRLDRENR